MKPILFSRLSVALLLAAGCSVATADTIKLKNGTVYEGKIVDDTANEYSMDVKEGNITDYKRIPKADVAEVKRDVPDEKEAADLIATLKVTPDALTAAEYEKRIKNNIQPWLDKYKTSKNRKAVEDLLKQYTEEATKVKAGDIKLRGEWITAAEAKWNEYNISARKLRVRLDSALKAKKYVEAYGIFAELDATYPASVDYPPSVEAMKKALPALEGEITRTLDAAKAEEDEHKRQLAAATPEKKRELDLQHKKKLEERKAEDAEFRKKVAEEKRRKFRVTSFYPHDPRTILDALNAVKKEVAYLGNLDIKSMTNAAKKFELGLKDMSEKAFLSAKSNFETAHKVFNKDATVKKKLDEATKAVTDAKGKPAGAKPVS